MAEAATEIDRYSEYLVAIQTSGGKMCVNNKLQVIIIYISGIIANEATYYSYEFILLLYAVRFDRLLLYEG